jgi:hypothetical protein
MPGQPPAEPGKKGRSNMPVQDKSARRQGSWRDHIKVHHAADLFPLMLEPELRELGEDIKKHGQKYPVVLWSDPKDHTQYLIDGRNRLDAMELVGLFENKQFPKKTGPSTSPPFNYSYRSGEPYDLVISFNIHRRHLTAEQRCDLIAKLIKAKPEESDRSIAEKVKRDHKTVAKVRKKMESTGEVSPVQKRIGADGKKRKARANKQEERDRKECIALYQNVLDAEKEAASGRRATGSAEISIEQRRSDNTRLDSLVALREEHIAKTTRLSVAERRKELIAFAHGIGFDIEIKSEPEIAYLAVPGFAKPAARDASIQGASIPDDGSIPAFLRRDAEVVS